MITSYNAKLFYGVKVIIIANHILCSLYHKRSHESLNSLRPVLWYKPRHTITPSSCNPYHTPGNSSFSMIPKCIPYGKLIMRYLVAELRSWGLYYLGDSPRKEIMRSGEVDSKSKSCMHLSSRKHFREIYSYIHIPPPSHIHVTTYSTIDMTDRENVCTLSTRLNHPCLLRTHSHEWREFL